MDKLSLTITGDAATIARVLSVLDPDIHTTESSAPNVLSTPTGAGIPVAPVSPQPLPNLAAPIQTAPFPLTPPISTTSADDDDDGPAAPNAPTIDKAGMPWDARIHTKNKATKADGTWKRGKGLDDGFVAAVEAELRGAAPAPAPLPIATIPAMQPVPLAPPTMPPVAPPPAPIPAPQPIPVAPPSAPVAPVAVNDFPGFMQHLGSLTTSGRVTPDYLMDLTQRASAAWQRQLGAITDLGTNPDMIEWVVQSMQAEGRW